MEPVSLTSSCCGIALAPPPKESWANAVVLRRETSTSRRRIKTNVLFNDFRLSPLLPRSAHLPFELRDHDVEVAVVLRVWILGFERAVFVERGGDVALLHVDVADQETRAFVGIAFVLQRAELGNGLLRIIELLLEDLRESQLEVRIVADPCRDGWLAHELPQPRLALRIRGPRLELLRQSQTLGVV